MLLRDDGDGVIAIGQQSHAWISGQLARAWGNELFPAPEPYEEVCLAAEQHDIGMAAWDLEPTYNPGTGLPHSFIEMPLRTHLQLWSTAPWRLLAQSRYAALLVSLHGWRLYERRDLNALTEDEAAAVRDYMDRERALQADLLASLRADPATAPTADQPTVERNSQLLWIWDFISLVVCLGWAPRSARDAPTVDGPVDLQLTPTDDERRIRIDPWPFRAERLRVHCDGRRLGHRYETASALDSALADASWESVEFELVGS